MNDKTMMFDKVVSSMKLRKPQEEALARFRDFLSAVDVPLADTEPDDLKAVLKRQYPSWSFADDIPEFTFHLATGVGKTRLIGALIAYLYLTKESENFVILTPRTEIIRKFVHETQPGADNYIFVDQTLIASPQVRGTDSGIQDLFSGDARGPRIWIISPQALTARDASVKKRGEYDAMSLVDYLKGLSDLVAFFDESHHLGTEQKSVSAWRSEILSLQPKFIIGTTGSVAEGSDINIMYSYDIKRCLNERLYTKLVRVIAQKKDEAMSAEDYDKLVLKFAWNQLSYKQQAIDDYQNANSKTVTKRVKAVMLVACENIEHAQQVTAWLQKFLNNRDAVLLVHSKLGENEFLPRLQRLEDPNSPVRIVVNVSMLNEGWDVSNIFVICPLRAMASSILITQVMGRGLRLPYGQQTQNEEVDTLDVLCFGRETMAEITDKILKQGFGKSGGVTVVDPPPEERKFEKTKKFLLGTATAKTSVTIPLFKLERPLLDLTTVSIPMIPESVIQTFEITDPRTIKRYRGNLNFKTETYRAVVATKVLEQCPYLSYQLQYDSMLALVDRFLNMYTWENDEIKIEPEKIVAHFKTSLDTLCKQVPAKYRATDASQAVDLAAVEINVLETFKAPIDVDSFDVRSWKSSYHRGLPFCGWKRSLLLNAPFDQVNELKIAKIIDHSAEVEWWFRNLPSIVSLPTPAGRYAPDFGIFFSVGSRHVLLEIKGDVFYGGDDQDATVKRNAAQRWCEAQAQASGEVWEYWFLLDSDADRCDSLEDIRQNARVASYGIVQEPEIGDGTTGS